MIARVGVAALAFVALVGLSVPAAAQADPMFSIRPFVGVTDEAFTAKNSFNAVFGKSTFPLVAGGVQVTILDQFYAEVSASKFEQTGNRVAVVNGQVFNLGIPLTATMTPITLTGGFRFRVLRHGQPIAWLRPYAGAGVAWYTYDENCTAAAATCAAVSGDFSGKHTGFVLNGGAEFRLHPWVGISADVQYTRVTGIIGQDGASQAFSENDLGGVAGRFRVIIGR
jgi:outer membrane protein W